MVLTSLAMIQNSLLSLLTLYPTSSPFPFSPFFFSFLFSFPSFFPVFCLLVFHVLFIACLLAFCLVLFSFISFFPCSFSHPLVL